MIPLCLAIAGALVYLNTLGNPFVFDDTPWITENDRIKSLANIGELLTTTNRPVLEVTLALNYAVGGLDPAGYHLFNLIIHVLAGLVLYGLVRRTLLLPEFIDRYRGSAHGLAGAVALIWLMHPLNTQAVTYLIQRGESMMGLFYLLTLYGYLRFATGDGKRWALVSVAACWLGMGTKEVIATAPIAVVLFDVVFITRTWLGPWRKRWGVLACLFAMWLPLAIQVTRGLSGEDASAGFALEAKLLSRWTYLLTQAQVIVEVYLRKAFWPNPLVLDYAWSPAIPGDTPPDQVARLFFRNVFWQGLLLVGLLLASLYGLIRRRWWGFAGFSFFLILAPTSSFVPIADLAVEHRMYLSLICVVVAVVFIGHALLRRAVPDMAGKLGALLVIVAALGLGVQTVVRNMDYQSRIALWSSVVTARPLNARGWHNLASALNDAGQPDEAMVCYEQVLKIVPTYAAAHDGTGVIWLERGDTAMAIKRFREAVRLEPQDASYHAHLGRALMFDQQFDQAENELREAIRLDPDYAQAHEALGLLYIAQKKLAPAIDAFRRAIVADPDLIASRQNLAAALYDSGRAGEAVAVLDEAIHYAGRHPELGGVLRELNARRDRYRAQAEQAPAGP